MKHSYKYIITSVILVVILLFAFRVLSFRIDLTEEKRFTISNPTKGILKNLKTEVKINIYLGEADANIAHLKIAINDILDEFSEYASTSISYSYINPSEAKSEKERNKNFDKLERRGLIPITISTRDADGKTSQTIIFPWADVMLNGDTLPVCIMKPIGMKNGEESVNAAIEDLEYNFIDAIRILNKTSFDKIAFIEGHDELTELETYSISQSLSRYFQIDRGVLEDDASIINDYKAIIIAKPTKPFSESDKFILDQYIMNGGKVIWLLDAITYSKDELSRSGISPVMALDVNLNDMLFRYGARIESSVVQDLQCLYMPINVATVGEPPIFEQIPFVYMPLLMTSPLNPITKNLMNVKSEFPSFIQQVSIENGISMEVLLATSNASRVVMAPTNIDLRNIANIEHDRFANAKFMPVAVLMSGEFQSIFKHRSPPENLQNIINRKDKSVTNKMVVIADGDIIKNEVEQSKEHKIRVVPLGLDRSNGQSYGNSNFIVNTTLSLTEDASLIQLRNRTVKLRMLDKQKISADKIFWQIFNIFLPLIILAIGGVVYIYIRHKLYNRTD